MRANGSREHKVNLNLHNPGIIDPVWQPSPGLKAMVSRAP
jgi:hypothetical protein